MKGLEIEGFPLMERGSFFFEDDKSHLYISASSGLNQPTFVKVSPNREGGYENQLGDLARKLMNSNAG